MAVQTNRDGGGSNIRINCGKAYSGVTRRRFVQGLIAGGVVAGLDFAGLPALAAMPTYRLPETLTGPKFDLEIEQIAFNVTGRPGIATAVNGSVPAPLLRMRENDAVFIAVTNRLKEMSSIHWHGFRIPPDMDGVPGLSFAGIAPGETFVYRFTLRQSGTYWYHAHSRFQEQTGLYGAVIIDPSYKDPVAYDREYVVLLSDWTNQDPEVIFSNLKQQSDYYNFHSRTVATFFADARERGLASTVSDYLMWARMNMSPNDILDVSGATYTYLMNGHPPSANWTALFRPRERIRLRFINASSMTIFDVRIPKLQMSVVQADGNDVEPVTVDEFRITVAETYDVIVQPPDSSAYTIFAQAQDSTGYARGTLAPALGMSSVIPPMDPRPQRTMVDMGGGSMQGMHEMHGTHAMSGAPVDPMPGEKIPDHLSPAETREFAKRRHLTGMSAPGQPGPRTSAEVTVPDMGGRKAPMVQSIEPRLGPQVDNIAEMPTDRLSSAGEGFPAGRRVLAYSDLRAIYRGTDPRPPDREIEIHLTGNMERFIWGFDGSKFSDAEPIRLKLGERVRIVLVNDTMMEHPIHLHGLWSELENGEGEFRPYKHTINVKPGERLAYLVSADVAGQWAFHCHLLYHMEAGMFRAVIVS